MLSRLKGLYRRGRNRLATELLAIRRIRAVTALQRSEIDPQGVGLWGFLGSQIGMGSLARGLADAMGNDERHHLYLHQIPLPGRDSLKVESLGPMRPSPINIAVVNPPELLKGRLFFPATLLCDTRRIGYWAWELSSMPEEWKPALALVDHVWGCSSFTCQSLGSATAHAVRRVPPVISDWVHPSQALARKSFPFLPADAFVFLSIFDFASGFHRKNPLGVVQAFNAAFGLGERPGPYLVLKFHSAFYHQAGVQALRSACEGNPRILLVDEVMSLERVRMLQDACDAYVSLHRAEGFGLTLAEAFLAGKPVICTAYSGNMDFADQDNCYLVDYTPVRVADGQYYYWKNQDWAEPSLDAAVAAMRAVFDNPGEARQRANRGREKIRRDYSAAAIGRVVQGILADRP